MTDQLIADRASAAAAGEIPRLQIRGVGRDFHTRSGTTHAVSGVDLDIQRG